VIAALFVDPKGVYSGLPDVDVWDEARDARLYPGPWPVVAHPPCQRWGPLANVNWARWGGEHNRPGNDGGCFASALASVRRWGGVLEHPAQSRAWAAHGLSEPRGRGWQRLADGGWVAEVWQSAYGHRARKATWLYAVVPCPPALDRRAIPGTFQVGYWDTRGKDRNKPTLGRREANSTPVAFRDVLLEMARSVTECRTKGER
jgi:hypothetical protein